VDVLLRGTIITTKMTLNLECKDAAEPLYTIQCMVKLKAEEELLARRVIGGNTTFKLLFNDLSTSEVDHFQFLDYNILD
jgi:hypothetical protein